MKQILTTLLCILYLYSATAQTSLVQHVGFGIQANSVGNKIVFKDKLIFRALSNAGWELWGYNDTTVQVIPTGGFLTHIDLAKIVLNNILYISLWTPATGLELYKWDGVNLPTIVADISPGTDGSNPESFATHNNKLYFKAADAVHGPELWVHDPVANTTSRLTDNQISPSASAYPVHDITVFNNKIYFVSLGPEVSYQNRPKLYVYDPVLGTSQLAPYFDHASISNAHMLNVLYGKLYFCAISASGFEYYMYDGNSAPQMLKDINPGSASSQSGTSVVGEAMRKRIIGFKGNVYFIAKTSGPSQYKLYRFDPNAGVSDFNPKLIYSFDYDLNAMELVEFIEFNGKLYFSGADNTHGVELWSYDGINNPVMVADINPGRSDSRPGTYAIYNNTLYFSASDGNSQDLELYRLGFGLSVENIRRVNGIKVFPVPAMDNVNFEINLSTDCSLKVILSDMNGRKVLNSDMSFHNRGQARLQMNIFELASGNYYYNIVTDSGVCLAGGKIAKQ